MLVPEFEALYVQEETYDPTKYMFEHVSGPCYDHIWVSALALNCTDARLKEIGELIFALECFYLQAKSV